MGKLDECRSVDLRTVAEVLQVAPALLRELAARGEFAPVVPLTRQTARVLVADLEEWELRSTLGQRSIAFPVTTEVLRREVLRRLRPERRRRPLAGGPFRPEGEDASRDLASLL